MFSIALAPLLILLIAHGVDGKYLMSSQSKAVSRKQRARSRSSALHYEQRDVRTDIKDTKELEYNIKISVRSLKTVATAHSFLINPPLFEKAMSLNTSDVHLIKDVRNDLFRELQTVLHKGAWETQLPRIFMARGRPSPFLSDPFASSRFCEDYEASSSLSTDKSSVTVGKPPKNQVRHLRTAVCLTGVTRTMSREDIRNGFRYNFLAGWGRRDITTFAVLVDDAEEAPTHKKSIKEEAAGLLKAVG